MRVAALPLSVIFLLPSQSLACAVCFGKSSNPNLAKAYTWGIFLLIGFTFFILGALALAVYRIEQDRKKRPLPSAP